MLVAPIPLTPAVVFAESDDFSAFRYADDSAKAVCDVVSDSNKPSSLGVRAVLEGKRQSGRVVVPPARVVRPRSTVSMSSGERTLEGCFRERTAELVHAEATLPEKRSRLSRAQQELALARGEWQTWLSREAKRDPSVIGGIDEKSARLEQECNRLKSEIREVEKGDNNLVAYLLDVAPALTAYGQYQEARCQGTLPVVPVQAVKRQRVAGKARSRWSAWGTDGELRGKGEIFVDFLTSSRQNTCFMPKGGDEVVTTSTWAPRDVNVVPDEQKRRRRRWRSSHGANECEQCMQKGESVGLLRDDRLSCMVCPGCGHVEEFLDFSVGNLPFGSAAISSDNCCYKRINHLNETLAQKQGKEQTNIPDELLDHLRKDLRKYKEQANPVSVKRSLKRVARHDKGVSRFFEHSSHISVLLGGEPTVRISSDIEEDIRNMFMRLQPAFDKFCPKNRTNFLSYSYTIHKILVVMGRPDLATHFHLLKSRNNLVQQDAVWRDMCAEVGWDFVPSV